MPRHFVFNWRVSLFALVFFIVFINLGLWQLSRETEKRELLAERAERLTQPPITAAMLESSGDLNGIRARLTGNFDDRFWLLDNRVLEGVVGFEVLHLFEDESAGYFLVNRGFVKMGRTRADMPEVPVLSGPVSILGAVYQPAADNLLLSDDPVEVGDVPILQAANPSQIGSMLGVNMYPFVIRLDEQSPGALPRYWPETVMTPEQHRGYAIQWFTMALAVLVVWVFFSWRKL